MWNTRMYRYPVEDVYRFHFKQPRDESPRRAEVPLPKPTYYSYRKDRPYKTVPDKVAQNKAERTEFEYLQSKGITTKDAPFGTLDTPTLTVKLIGSEYKPVILDQRPKYNEDYLGPRVQPLDQIPNPPQRSDPREFDDMPGGVYSNAKDDFDDYDYSESWSEPPHSAPTALISRRPDSKDLARSQFKILPKVQALRKRMDESTVFEREPWTGNENPPLARDTEYKHNYHPEFDNDMEYPDPRQGQKLYVSDSEKHSVMMLVPRNVLLPSEPIVLPKDKERILCKLTCLDLEGFKESKLRDIYMDASRRDPDLNGYCDIQYLDSVLREHGAYLSADTFRVLAAQFVNPQPGKLNKVNYEKILSFIGSALDLNRKGQLSDPPPQVTTNQPEADPQQRANDGKRKFYQDVTELAKKGSLYKDHEVAKLLRMVEQELSKSTYDMDWTKWYDAFNAKDREHRETLSGKQIKDICFDLRLPLSNSILDQILWHCEDGQGDGQFYWQSFLGFLSRVRPSNTGLPIPVSKRPLEYAKHYPAPVPNWPRAEDVNEPIASQRKDQQRQDYYEQTNLTQRRETSPRKPQDDRENFAADRKVRLEQQPLFRERSPPVQHELMNGSPEIDLQPEFDRHAKREGRQSRLFDEKPRENRKALQEQQQLFREKSPPVKHEIMNGSPEMDLQPQFERHAKREGRSSRFFDEKPSVCVPSWQERYLRLDNIPQKELDPRFRDHNYRTYPPHGERPRSYAEPQRPGEPRPYNDDPHFRNRSTSPIRYQSPPRYRSPPPPVRFHSPSKRRQFTYRYDDRGRDHGDRTRDRPPGPPGHGREEGPSTHRPNREDQIKDLSEQLRSLETKYKITKDAISTNQKPWLDRYLKMANALYSSDISNRGCLPKRDVLDIVRQYNGAFNLNLDEYRVNELLTDPSNLDRAGMNVILQPFLSKLSA